MCNHIDMLDSILDTEQGCAETFIRSHKKCYFLQLATMLVHFVYDGVYATKEERIHGGGSLELKKHVAESLGLDHEDITSD